MDFSGDPDGRMFVMVFKRLCFKCDDFGAPGACHCGIVAQLFSGTNYLSFFCGCPTKNGLPQKGFPFFPGSLNN